MPLDRNKNFPPSSRLKEYSAATLIGVCVGQRVQLFLSSGNIFIPFVPTETNSENALRILAHIWQL